MTFVRCASALGRILVLCDGCLLVLAMNPELSALNMSGSSKLKNVTAACVNENPNTDDPFSVQVGIIFK